ncbi:hypothetical protein PGT21_030175 [Puccinia graminis f. sp. tritici]|uniref:Cyanovirin-N domain-containing protein n=1 Tax=Puccinia graminis f. sp. tritici TaxID=56615 RepID=A0A5B0M8A3_PUCGR|nr:hypothetical protein PGT21_030175 [Puccinia graminis f. sp. tritici]KAA1078521.1 hypothetical protein PGTUg99_004787 [Puccinia graminis f. sp. tritici]
MFAPWFQRSYNILSAVLMMALISCGQLNAATPGRSLERRYAGDIPFVWCGFSFSLTARDPWVSNCQNDKQERFRCHTIDCPGEDQPQFELRGCQRYATPRAELEGTPQNMYPVGYHYNDITHLLEATDRDGFIWGCQLAANNNNRVGCHGCARVS